jgi:hypothetical protein
MRDVRAALGIREPRDPIDLNEHFGQPVPLASLPSQQQQQR